MPQSLKILFFSRLAFSKDTTVNTTAGATVRHLVSAVYDRAMSVKDAVPATSKGGLADLPPTVTDAYMLFQDLIQLVNADQPIWLQVQIDELSFKKTSSKSENIFIFRLLTSTVESQSVIILFRES